MIKKLEIDKSSVNFTMGIDKPDQLLSYLSVHSFKPAICMVGRSNVGKSSLINALFGAKTARVSKTPGRTRQVNIFEFKLNDKNKDNVFLLYDLPGYGHAEVSKEMGRNWQDLMQIFFDRTSPQNLVLNIQDARHPATAADMELAKYMKHFDKEVYLIFNKIDKLKKQSERAALKKLQPELSKKFKWCRQIFYVSAEDKEGVPELEQSVINFLLKKSLIDSV